MEMILDPLRSTERAIRYPDETIVPTGLVSLQDSLTHVSGPVLGGVPNTFYTDMKWKVVDDDPATGVDDQPICTPTQLGAPRARTRFNQQSQWLALSSVDRTLACAIRARVVGLPPATFLPSGTLYFIQYQNVEYLDLVTSLAVAGESAARAAIAAKKGFTCTVNEISKTDGVTLPFLPQGPMSFVFSDSNTSAAASAGVGSLVNPVRSSVVSANGGIIIVGFGLQDGVTLRLDYGSIIEYIPRATAAGLVQTAVQPPSSAMRDSISTGAAMIQQTISGATSLSSISRVVAGGAMSAAAQVARGVIAGVPGGPLVMGGLSAAAEGLGAPTWLRSALAALT